VNLLQACHRPQAPLGHRNFQLHLNLCSREKSALRWIVRVSGIGSEEIGITHGVNEIYRWLNDELNPLAGLAILNSDSAIDLDDGNRVVFVHIWPGLFAVNRKIHCQFALLRAASNCCARTDTASPATADPSGPSGARAAINARAAATLVLPGMLRSSAISRKIATGSQVVRSTPSSAFADASAREGRPALRLDFPGVVVGSSAIDRPFILRCNVTAEGFLACRAARRKISI
jgi:hypothetical protein